MSSFDKIIDRRNTNSLKHDFAKEKEIPEDALSMWIADMDFRVPDSVISALQKSVDHGIFGYSDVKSDYYETIAKWFREYFGWETKEEWLVKTPGVVFALAMGVRALTEKGDAVIIQPPVYYPFFNVINSNGRKLIENPLIYKDGRYEIDFEDFEKKIIENDVKLFIFCSPHNPVCRVWTEEELKKLGAICKKHGVNIIADEIHCDFTYEGHKHTMFPVAVPEMADNVIVCTAPSKTFNIAGLQISNIFIPGAEIREKFMAELAGAGFTVSNNLGLVACRAAYEGGREWFEQCKAYIGDNLSYVREFLKENIPAVKLVEPDGTYFAWLDFTQLGLTRDELNDMIINKAKLWLDAGDIFGSMAGQFQRIVLACPKSVVEKAMAQLRAAVAEL